MDVYGYCLDDPVNFVDPLGLRSHNGMHGAFGGGNIGGRAKSSLGSNRSKNKDSDEKSSDTNSNKSIGHGGVFGAFGTGKINGKANSSLGFNGNTSLKTTGNPTNSNSYSMNELGGYNNYSGYAGPSFAEYLGTGFKQKASNLANLSDLWSGMPAKPTAQQTRQEKRQNLARRGVIDLNNNTPSPLTKTVNSTQPDKPEGSVGTSIITGKSSAQHDWEMESLVKTKNYSTPSLTQDQPEDVSVGIKTSAKKEQPKKEQYIAIGKFGVPQSLLIANAKKQQAKTGMLDTKEEGGVLDALGKMGDGFSTAVSKFADVFDTQGDDVINYGPYVSNETKDIMNKMAKQAHETGKKSARGGIKRFGPVGVLTYPVGSAYGAADYMLRGPVFDSVKKQMQNWNSN